MERPGTELPVVGDSDVKIPVATNSLTTILVRPNGNKTGKE
jgi:hypothetical protein